MVWFILLFLLMYGALHAYVLWHVWSAFPHLGAAGVPLAGFMALMTFSPILVYLLDRWRRSRLTRALATVGYSWMAVIFWLALLLAAADAWNLAVRGAALVAPAARAAILPAGPTLAAMAVVIAAAFSWGLVEARRIRVRRLTIPVARVPGGRERLRIVQISDLHLGIHTGRRRLARIVEGIRRLQPDLLVSTGDLVDSSFHNVDSMSEMLAGVDAPLGKFGVLGNHDFYAGVGGSLAFHEAAGFRMLRGQAVEVTPGLRIVGVDDPAGERAGTARLADERPLLAGERDGAFVLLLKHRPTVADEAPAPAADPAGPPGPDETTDGRPRFDLQLSGHTHGGQVFPWHYITRMTYPLDAGLHRLDGGALLYVSRGTGTWGPPIRVLAPPEITVLTLEARPRRRGTEAAGAQS
jgi:predicted MPP superfamily phosphohydrolase